MERRAAVAGVLALAILLAGCQFGGTGTGTGGASSADESETPTASGTPAPFGDASPPPGVDAAGVTDVDELMASHAATLEGTSSTVDIDFHLTVNGSGDRASLRGKSVPGSDHGWMTVEFEDGTGTYYTEDERTYYREVVDDQVTYGTTDELSAIPAEPRFGADERIRTAIESADWTPVGTVERDGRTLFEFEATHVDPPDVSTSDNATVEATGRLLVDGDGVVHHVEIDTTVETDRGTVSYGLTVSLSEMGTTTIERPEWYENASDG
jgi:hypothetical protein